MYTRPEGNRQKLSHSLSGRITRRAVNVRWDAFLFSCHGLISRWCCNPGFSTRDILDSHSQEAVFMSVRSTTGGSDFGYPSMRRGSTSAGQMVNDDRVQIEVLITRLTV